MYHKIQINFDYGEIDIYRSWIMALFLSEDRDFKGFWMKIKVTLNQIFSKFGMQGYLWSPDQLSLVLICFIRFYVMWKLSDYLPLNTRKTILLNSVFLHKMKQFRYDHYHFINVVNWMFYYEKNIYICWLKYIFSSSVFLGVFTNIL